MPKKAHPKDALATVVTDIQEVSVQALKTEQGSQSNQVFKLTGLNGKALGSGGETTAFAKPVVGANEFKADRNLNITTSFLFEQRYNAKGPDKKVLRDPNGKVLQPGMVDNPESFGDRGMITRQVASYEADKLLGLNAVAQEKFGRNQDGSLCGVSVQADGGAAISNKAVLNVDLSRPDIQRGLSDLEVSDFITGQADRHPANIFIDPKTGKVTGIDNDMSLPEVSREEILRRGVDFNGKMVTGMPRMMHQETADKILRADPEELRATLSKPPPGNPPQPLSQSAIDGAVNRLVALQTELGKPNSSIAVVQQFNQNTYDSMVQQQKDMYNNSPDAVNVGSNWDNIPAMDTSTLDVCPKNSYIGSLTVALHKNGLAPQAQRMPVSDLAPKAERVQGYDHELFSKIAEAYPQMTPNQQKGLDKDIAKMQKLQDQVAQKEKHLLKPTFTDKLKALGEGMNKVKTHKQDHINDLEMDIAGLKAKMTRDADHALGPKTKVGFANDEEMIPSKSQKNDSVGGLGQNAQSQEKSVDGQNAKSQEQSVDGQDVSSGNDIDELDGENALSQDESVEGPDVGPKIETPQVNRRHSVRDDLPGHQKKETGGNSIKEKPSLKEKPKVETAHHRL